MWRKDLRRNVYGIIFGIIIVFYLTNGKNSIFVFIFDLRKTNIIYFMCAFNIFFSESKNIVI